MDAITHIQPDVVMMDFFLPHLDAIGVMKGIRRSSSPCPQFMVMSSYDNPIWNARPCRPAPITIY